MTVVIRETRLAWHVRIRSGSKSFVTRTFFKSESKQAHVISYMSGLAETIGADVSYTGFTTLYGKAV